MGLRKGYLFVYAFIILILISNSSFSGTCLDQFEYILSGGAIGDDRIYNSLEINADGSCYFYSLNGECCFNISKELSDRITAMGISIIRKNNTRREHFIVDSLTSYIKTTNCSDNTLYKAAFYADRLLEKHYPEQKRPDEFLELENVLKKLILKNCSYFMVPE